MRPGRLFRCIFQLRWLDRLLLVYHTFFSFLLQRHWVFCWVSDCRWRVGWCKFLLHRLWCRIYVLSWAICRWGCWVAGWLSRDIFLFPTTLSRVLWWCFWWLIVSFWGRDICTLRGFLLFRAWSCRHDGFVRILATILSRASSKITRVGLTFCREA